MKFVICISLMLFIKVAIGQSTDTLVIDWNETSKMQSIDDFLDVYY